MKSTRLLCTILSLAFVMGMAACSSKTSETTKAKEDETTTVSESGEDLDIDAILARAENVDRSQPESAAEELLNSFNVTSIRTGPSDEEYWSKVLPEDAAKNAEEIDATMHARNEAMKAAASTQSSAPHS